MVMVMVMVVQVLQRQHEEATAAAVRELRRALTLSSILQRLGGHHRHMHGIVASHVAFPLRFLRKLVPKCVFLKKMHFLLEFCKGYCHISKENPKFALKLPKSGI